MVYSTMYTWEIRKAATSAFFETPKRVVTKRKGGGYSPGRAYKWKRMVLRRGWKVLSACYVTYTMFIYWLLDECRSGP